MSSGDWEEVKRLAADFQRAQLTSAAQRLTDRNCIEIVNKLLELKLLDVVFTSDGKEYVTPQQLSKEILDELYVNGGRLALSDLSTNLNVSLNSITARVLELIKVDKNCYFVLGQLLTSEYLDSLAYDLNERLSQDGVLSLNDVSKNADLPGEFLHEQLLRRLGKIIKGKQDETEVGVIYTEAFVRRNTAKVRGILSAITKPTPVNQILGKVEHLPEKLFFQILNKLLVLKRIDGIISGSSRSAYFIPSIYSKSQINYIEGFMKGNGYIDLEVAARLGITDPKSFVQKRFPNEKLTFLKTCCLGEALFKQVNETVEESLASPGWVDISLLIPFSITEKDVELLVQLMSNSNSFVFGSTIVNRNLVQGLQANFKPLMSEKALKDIESGRYIKLLSEIRANEKKSKTAELNANEYDSRSHKKDDRRKKAAGGKGGGGTQGRETKTKSTKKKYMAGKRDMSSDSEEEAKPISNPSQAASKTQLPFLSVKEIQTLLRKEESLKEGQDDLIRIIASQLIVPLTEEYQLVLKATYDIFVTEKCGRKSKEELLRRTKKHLNTLKLYVDGLGEFDGDIKSQLEKFLSRTFGQEVISAITQFLLVEAGFEADGKVTDLPADVANSLYQLGKVSSPAQLLEEVELHFQLKTDKNLDVSLVEARESLETELNAAKESKDPALFLHIFILLVFSLKTKKLIQASGKFVPQILIALQTKLTAEEFVKIKSHQDAVVRNIKSKGAEDLGTLYEDLDLLLKSFKV